MLGLLARLAAAAAHLAAAERARHDVRVVRHDGDVAPAGHQLALLARPAVGLCGEDLHHVFLGVGGGVGGSVAVLRDVEGFLRGRKQFQDVRGWRGVDDRGGD